MDVLVINASFPLCIGVWFALSKSKGMWCALWCTLWSGPVVHCRSRGQGCDRLVLLSGLPM